MKRIHFILSCLILSSCGGDYPHSQRLGQIRVFAPVVLDAENINRLTTLCNALNQKVQQVGIATSASATFNVVKSTCGKAQTSSREVVAVKGTAPFFFFERTDQGHIGEPFSFPFETHQSDIMGTICSGLGDPKNALMVSGSPVWFSTTATRDCAPRANEVCIFIEKGAKGQNATEYQVIEQEWIKFQLETGNPRYGYYNERKRITSLDCADDKVTEVRIRLID